MSQKFLSPVKLSGISTGSILKVNSSGVIVAAVNGTDYNTGGSWITSGNNIYYNTGSVGIGESSPDGILHIKGSSQVTEFYIESSTGTASTSGAIKIAQNNRSAEDFAGEMVFYVQDNNVGGTYWREAMAIINSGNIAIGSTDPGNYRLKVTGSANITGAVTLSNYGAGFLKADANGLLSVDTSTYITGYTETDTLASVTARGASTTTRTTFTEAGVSRDGSDTLGAGPWFRWTDASTSRQILLQLNASNGLTTWAYNGSSWSSIQTITQGGDLIINSGNVLIGTTTNPYSKGKLVVEHTSTYDRSMFLRGVDFIELAPSGLYGSVNVITSNYTSAGSAYAPLALSARQNTSDLYLSTNGNIGIGTTSPTNTLDVLGGISVRNSNGGGAINVGTSSGRSQYQYITLGGVAGGTDYGWQLGRSPQTGGVIDDGFYIYDIKSNSTPFAIALGGNVGIGTTSPTGTYGKLTVNGSISLLDDQNTKLEIGRYSSGASNSYIKLGANSNSLRVTNNNDTADIFTITNAGNVGIGTTSPSYTLDVKKDVDTWLAGVHNTGSDANAQALLVRSDATSAHDAAVLGVYADGGYKMMVRSTGKVGINTTSPEDKLHVLVTSTSAAQGIYLDSGGGSAGAAYLNVSTSNGPVLTGNTTPAGLARGPYKASRMQFNASGFKFEHSAEETTNAARTWSTHMVINASGDVGIGVTSPSTKLHVDGTITASGIKTENTATVIDNTGIQPAQGEVEDIVQFKWSGTEVASIDTDGYVTATGYKAAGTTGYLRSDGSIDTNAYISSSTLYSTIAFTINGNDVQIGDEVSIGSGLSFDSNTYTISSSDTLDSVTGRGATTTNAIGTGNLTINSSGSAASYIYLLSSTTGESELRMGDTDTDAGSIAYNNNLDRMAFRTNAAERVYIDSSGNVGIGVSSPAQRLDVLGKMKITDDIILAQINGRIDYDNGNEGGALRFWSTSAASERMRITSAGNVGIGTTSPVAKLQIGNGTSNASNRSSVAILSADGGNAVLDALSLVNSRAAANGNGTAINFHNASNYSPTGRIVSIQDDGTNASLRFSVYNSTDNQLVERVTLLSSGNVGIGTTSPGEKLHVLSSGNTVARFETSLTSDMAIELKNSQGSMFFGLGGGEEFAVGTDADLNGVNSKFVVKSSGNVGIGTTSPSSILHISASSPILTISNTDTSIVNEQVIGQIDFKSLDSSTNMTAVFGSIRTEAEGTLDNGVNDGGKMVFSTFKQSTSLVDQMVIDASGNVGIGTTSPDVKLHVNSAGTLNSQEIVLGLSSTSQRPMIQFSESAVVATGNGMSIEYDGRLSSGNNKMYINGVDNSPKLTVMAGGNVGIGTTSPDKKLVVAASSQTWGGAPQIAFYDTTSGQTGARNWTVGAISTSWGNFTIASSDAAGGDPTTARLTITNAGNVGIGTTSPSYKLQVNGTAYINETLYVNGETTFDGTSNFNTNIVNASAPYASGDEYIKITNPNDNSGTLMVANNGNTWLNADGGKDLWLNWYSLNSASSKADLRVGDGYGGTLMSVIGSSGNVGIGTSSPSQKLHVVGRIMAEGTGYTLNPASPIFGQYTSTRGYVQVPSNGQLEIWNGGTAEIATFYENKNSVFHGNVGIGTTSPAFKLDVNGNTRIGGNSGSNTARLNVGGVANEWVADFQASTTANQSYGLVVRAGTSSTDFPFYVLDSSNSTAFFAIKGNGNVGIGTTSPAQKLDVNGSIRAQSGTVYFGTNAYDYISYSSTNGYYRANTTHYFEGNGFFKGAWDSSGRLGIGTSSPSEKLHVNSGSGNVPALFESTDALSLITFKDNSTTTTVGVGASANDIVFYSASERMRIDSSGNVGIGTTSPSYKLDVNGSFNCTSMNVTENISTSAGNVVVQNGAGIYSIKSTIGTSTSGTAFRIANTNDVQAARVTFVAETANYQVAKIYEVVKAGTADPVAFKVVDTGPSGEEDFSVAFSNDGGDLLCTVTNDSANESLTLVTTIFVGGSNTSQTVSNS